MEMETPIWRCGNCGQTKEYEPRKRPVCLDCHEPMQVDVMIDVDVEVSFARLVCHYCKEHTTIVYDLDKRVVPMMAQCPWCGEENTVISEPREVLSEIALAIEGHLAPEVE